MSLKIKLGPNEVLFIGQAQIRNGSVEADLAIEGDDIPVLRQKDRIPVSLTNTPCQRLHILIEKMYLEKINLYIDKYIEDVKKIEEAAPSLKIYIALVSERVLSGELYQALKRMKAVIEHERILIDLQLGQAQKSSEKLN